MTADPDLVSGPVAVFGQDRATTAVAQQMRPLDQPVTHAHPVVEDETRALPGALRLGHFLEVFQDPALEVVYLLDPLPQQVVRGLLAADPPGAEHRDFLVVEPMLVGLPPGRKLAEGTGLRVHGARETADRHLVVVAGVDHRDILARDQVVPRLRRDVMPGARQRIDIGLAHGDDLALEAHLHLAEGRGLAVRELPLEVLAAGQRAQMGDHRVDARACPRDGAVDPFPRQQQRAFHTVLGAERVKRGLERGRVVEPGEVVEGGDGIHGAADRGIWGCSARAARAKFACNPWLSKDIPCRRLS